MAALSCVFCGTPLPSARCVWVQLPDGGDFVCCPTMCAPMRDAVEARRRALASQLHELTLPLPAA